MKRLAVVVTLFALTIALGFQGVFAEEAVEVIAEPSAFDNWVDVVSDFASLKNFIVSIGGLATLLSLNSLRKLYKFLRSANGLKAMETMGFNILKKVTDTPELVIKIMAIVVEFPIIKGIIDNAKRKVDMYETEVLDKIVNIEGKLEANLFADNPDSNKRAIELLTKLREEYETIQLNK